MSRSPRNLGASEDGAHPRAFDLNPVSARHVSARVPSQLWHRGAPRQVLMAARWPGACMVRPRTFARQGIPELCGRSRVMSAEGTLKASFDPLLTIAAVARETATQWFQSFAAGRRTRINGHLPQSPPWSQWARKIRRCHLVGGKHRYLRRLEYPEAVGAGPAHQRCREWPVQATHDPNFARLSAPSFSGSVSPPEE